MTRKNYSSGAPWEDLAGYSRAVRIGNTIEVAGTTAMENGHPVFENDAAGQTRVILQKIEAVLAEAGAELKDVVRTRIYLTNIDDWEQVVCVHGQFFKTVRPAATLVAVQALIDSKLLVEIEVSAIVG